MLINFDYYRIFYYVAKYKNFTQAADALMNNQPNLTRCIKNLENELGCVLFVRSNRGASLTPEGEKLYKYISVACERIQAGEQALSLDKSLQSGIISIGASETALHGLLLPVLRRFHNSYPGIRIRISNHSTPQAIAALRDGVVDLAVVTTPTGVEKPLCEIPLQTFHEVPVCGPALSFLTDRILSLKDLLRYPLICLGRDTKSFEFYSKLFFEQGLVLSPDIEAATADQILPMVKHDLGIGFVPEAFICADPQQNNIFRLTLDIPVPERRVCLVKRRDHFLSIAAGELEKMLLGEK